MDDEDGNGLITIASAHAVRETIDRLAAVVTANGLTVFVRVDHGAGAAAAGMALRATELLIFGHPQGGTPLMQDRRTVAIDLPMKALAWEDESGTVWLTTNDPAWIAERHALGLASAAAVAAIAAGMAAVTKAAAGG